MMDENYKMMHKDYNKMYHYCKEKTGRRMAVERCSPMQFTSVENI
jgi:hypothetical protein